MARRISQATLNAYWDYEDDNGNTWTPANSFDANLGRDMTNHPDISSDPSLEAYFIQREISYRIFTTNVTIERAKWSRAQVN